MLNYRNFGFSCHTHTILKKFLLYNSAFNSLTKKHKKVPTSTKQLKKLSTITVTSKSYGKFVETVMIRLEYNKDKKC